jgi:hypothetical protein
VWAFKWPDAVHGAAFQIYTITLAICHFSLLAYAPGNQGIETEKIFINTNNCHKMAK